MLFIKVEWGYGECQHYFCCSSCENGFSIDKKVKEWAKSNSIECPSLSWSTIQFDVLH
jgi:hypothetical protein